MSLTDIAVAHRGGAGLAPENTLAAFEMSHALGLRLLETDVQVTKDGVALAFHDATLARTAGVDARVRDLTWEELRAVRVGGEPILRLDTLLDAFPDASFLIDLKTVRAAAPLVDAVRRTRSAERVCVADGRDTWLRDVAETTGCARSLGWRGLLTLMGAAKTGTRAPRRVLHGAFAAHIATRLGGIPWMADARAAARLVDMTHDAGLRLVTWTVNDSAQMTRYLDAGVDSVITDRPDLLREVLVARDAWTAPEGSPLVRTQPKRTAPLELTRTPTRAPSSSVAAVGASSLG